MTIDFRSDAPFYSLPNSINDEIKEAASKCIALQRSMVPDDEQIHRSTEIAMSAVAEENLYEILESGADIHGISANSEISDVVVFNSNHIDKSINDSLLTEVRDNLDAKMAVLLRDEISKRRKFRVACSGHFWYPPGSYMGWHTNNKAAGWRAYLTYATKPGRSFFRYRDPRNGEIVTSLDGEWDLRIFRVDPRAPLWHAVYSETDRFSFGYAIVEKGLISSLVSRAKSIIS